MKRLTPYYIYYTILALFLTACNGDAHDDENSYLNQAIAIALSWFDPADIGTDIDNFAIEVTDAAGNVVAQVSGMSKKDVANFTSPIAPGTYTVSVVSSPFYSICEVTSNGKHLAIANAQLKRAVSILTIEVSEAPEGTTLDAIVHNAANDWSVERNDDGSKTLRIGNVPTPFNMPTATATAGTATSGPEQLMPTIPSAANSLVEVVVKSPQDHERRSLLTCERMEPGGKYTIRVKYSDINTPLALSTITITPWEKIFVYEGEVTDPKGK